MKKILKIVVIVFISIIALFILSDMRNNQEKTPNQEPSLTELLDSTYRQDYNGYHVVSSLVDNNVWSFEFDDYSDFEYPDDSENTLIYNIMINACENEFTNLIIHALEKLSSKKVSALIESENFGCLDGYGDMYIKDKELAELTHQFLKDIMASPKTFKEALDDYRKSN